jgi:hypothetical protein
MRPLRRRATISTISSTIFNFICRVLLALVGIYHCRQSDNGVQARKVKDDMVAVIQYASLLGMDMTHKAEDHLKDTLL